MTSSFYSLSTPTVTEVATVQAQLDEAASLTATFSNYINEPTNTQSSNYTLQLSDMGKLVAMNISSVNTLIVPPNSTVAFPVGAWINLTQLGTGKTTLVAGTGVTINTALGLSLRAQYSGGSIIQTSANTWLLIGDLDT